MSISKEFDVNQYVKFPPKLITKFINGYYIIIAQDNPNWIVLDSDEVEMFDLLKKYTIKECLIRYKNEFKKSEEFCINKMISLLSKIENSDFYEDAILNKEEPMELIEKRIHINLTNNCNMRCDHCFVSAGIVERKSLDYYKLIEKVKEIQSINGLTEVVLSGGEPLVYEHIYELLNELSDNYIVLFTNGTLINQNNYLNICNNISEIQISFEGVSEEVYEKIRGKGNYAKVIRAINLLKTQNIRIVLAITILPSTLYDVRDNLLSFIESLEYDNLEIRLNNEIEMTGNALNLDFSNYNKLESDKILINLMEELKNNGVTIKSSTKKNVRYTNCGIGTNIVIDYDGKIYPCNKFSSYYIPFDTEVTKLIDSFNKLNKETSCLRMKSCKSCYLKYICCGGCRIDNFKKNGDMLVTNCTEEFKNNKLKELIKDYLNG